MGYVVLQLPIDKHLEQLRRVLVYEIFISYFIDMARVSLKYLALNQSLIYLKQASRLCSLLQDDQHPCDTYITQIDDLHHDVLMEGKRDSQLRPQLPRRESSMEIPSKIKFRIKMSRSNSRSIDEDPYSNIAYIKNRIQSVFPSVSNDMNDIHSEPIETKKTEDRSPRFNRYLLPNTKAQLKRQKSNLTTTAQIHSKNSPKSPRTPIKCVNFFDEDELSSGNNSPIIRVSDCGDDQFKRDGRPAGHHLKSPLVSVDAKIEVTFDKENIKNNINQIYGRSDVIQSYNSCVIEKDADV